MEESDQQQPQLLSVCMEGEQEMVIQVENARSLQGTTLVPVQVIPDVSAIPRNGGIEWNSQESKVLLENYVRYVPQVGPDKKFRSKKDMFKRIAEHIFEETGKRRTGEQCENRYKTIMRRKRRNGEGSTTGLARARILLHKAAVQEDGEEEEEEHIIEEEEPEIEEEEGQSKQEELQPEVQQEEPEDDEPELLAELAAMGDDEQRMIRRSSRRRKNTSTIDQQLLLDRLHELHEQRERRRDERERRRDLRHAEQMSLLRRILSVLERQPLTTTPTVSRLRVATTHR
uniref:Myb-like domain-containing protein n=1 Tax=Rhipicephalus pulchellus TaxID=72859 RepID=L7LWN7_RHIPC